MQKRKVNQYALTGFILGLVSLFLNILGTMSIMGLVMSIMGLIKIESDDSKSKTFATIGLILCVLTLGYAIYALVQGYKIQG